jgi:WD40 repeat protein
MFFLSGAKGSEPSVAPPITALAIAPDGKSLLTGSQAGLRRLSWPELEPQGPLKTGLSHIHDLAFSPRGDLVAVAGGAPGEAGMVEVFAWPESKLKYRAQPQADLIYAAAWAPDGRRLATASYDHTVNVLDASSGERIRKLEGHSRGVLAVSYLPDGKTIVSAGADNSLRVWDAESGRAIRTLDNHTAGINDLAVRPGQPRDALPLVASVSDDRTVRLWQPTIGRMVRFARLASVPTAVAWSESGKQLVVACADGHARMIDPETLEVLADVHAVEGRTHSLAVPPGESGRIAVGGAQSQTKAVTVSVAKWGHLRGQFLYDGEPPKPRMLKVDCDREAFGESVPDESLLVNPKNRGVANIVVYILPKSGEKLAVHPSYEKTAKNRVTLAFHKGRFEPRILLMRTGQTMCQENRDNVPAIARIAFWENANL